MDEFTSADALDFIVKPVPPYAFQLKMTRALFRVARSASDRITVRQNGSRRGKKTEVILIV